MDFPVASLRPDVFLHDLIHYAYVYQVFTNDYSHFKITFIDGFEMEAIIDQGFSMHAYYTRIDPRFESKYYYRASMPHQSISDFYQEIARMSRPETRTLRPRNNSFKA